jgi:hypothetical protein
LLPMHSYFAPTYMYRLPQLACTPAHWLGIVILIVLLFIMAIYFSLLLNRFFFLNCTVG